MARILFNEESDYGQDVLELVAMCVSLEENTYTITQLRKRLREINGKLNQIGSKLYSDNVDYWALGGEDAAFRFSQ